MKHTPGSWKVTEVDDDRRSFNELPVVVTFAPEHLQRRFHATGKELMEEDKANAILIEAAPELLKALEVMPCLAVQESEHCSCIRCAALALAKGE